MNAVCIPGNVQTVRCLPAYKSLFYFYWSKHINSHSVSVLTFACMSQEHFNLPL